MKSKKAKAEGAAPSPKGKVKVKNLKLAKETVENLTDQDAAKVKGGSGKYCYVGGCWVARTVYGEDNPRWMLFRDWLMADAPTWFRSLYLRHGERFALWLTPHAVLKSAIRLWMDSIIDRRHATAPLVTATAR